MLSKLLCWIGVHHWIVRRNKSSGEIICEYRARRAKPGEYTGNFLTMDSFKEKTCCRCGKHIDEISRRESELVNDGYFVNDK